MPYVSCPPGLEEMLLEELKELGATKVAIGHRGVQVDDESKEILYRILYGSRLAARVLLPIERFPCRGRDDLYKRSGAIEWSDYMQVDQTLAIDVHGQHPEFRNTLFAAQVVKDAICDQMRERYGRRPSVQPYRPDLQLHLFLEKGRATLSVDAAGGPLHKRGYRRQSAKAPLQENLAAAIVRMAGYSGEQLLVDPCCGSGTLLIEAAMVASSTPAGFYRTKWAVSRLPGFDRDLWQRVCQEMNHQRRSLPRGRIVGIDHSSEAIAAARTNLSAAGFGKSVELIQSPFQECKEVRPQLVVTNPPLGKRLEGDEQLYRDLGHFLRTQCERPAGAYVLVGSRQLGAALKLPADKRIPLEASGLKATLHVISLFERSGSN